MAASAFSIRGSPPSGMDNAVVPLPPTRPRRCMTSPAPAPAWQDAAFSVLKKGRVAQIAYVPDAGHAATIREARSDPAIRDVVLTTEEEGVALVCGAWLRGSRAVLRMQSSGVGNCVNMFSLLTAGQFPFLALVTMRGEYAEFNPWQGPMGRGTPRAVGRRGVPRLGG